MSACVCDITTKMAAIIKRWTNRTAKCNKILFFFFFRAKDKNKISGPKATDWRTQVPVHGHFFSAFGVVAVELMGTFWSMWSWVMRPGYIMLPQKQWLISWLESSHHHQILKNSKFSKEIDGNCFLGWKMYASCGFYITCSHG